MTSFFGISVYLLMARVFQENCNVLSETGVIDDTTRYSDYCKQDCNATYNKEDLNKFCQPCKCDEKCYVYGDCCPGREDKSSSISSKCLLTVFPPTDGQSGTFYQLVSSCPEDQLIEVKEKCRNPDQDFSSVQPTFDSLTNLVYRNRYCAECNGAGVLKPWPLEFTCLGPLPRRYGHSYDDVYNTLSNMSNCHASFQPPPGDLHSRTCRASLVENCNDTGQWQTFDRHTNMSCKSFPSLAVKNYRNLFCYKCNSDLDWDGMYKERSAQQQQVDVFKLTLNNGVKNLTGKPTQIWDEYQGICIDVDCADGKIMFNGKCIPVLTQENIYNYTMCIDYSFKISNTYSASVGAARFGGNRIGLSRHDRFKIFYSETVVYQLSTCQTKLEGKSETRYYIMTRYPTDLDDDLKELIQMVEKFGQDQEKDMLFGRPIRSCSREMLEEQQTEYCRSFELKKYTSDKKPVEIMGLLNVSKLYICPRVTIPSTFAILSSDGNMLFIKTNGRNLSVFEFEVVEDGYMVCLETYLMNITDSEYTRCNDIPTSHSVAEVKIANLLTISSLFVVNSVILN